MKITNLTGGVLIELQSLEEISSLISVLDRDRNDHTRSELYHSLIDRRREIGLANLRRALSAAQNQGQTNIGVQDVIDLLDGTSNNPVVRQKGKPQ
jgi:superfamily I DNA/RNA helicase